MPSRGGKDLVAEILVDIGALKGAQLALREFPSIMDNVIKESIKDILLYVEKIAKEHAPTDTGRLKQSIHVGNITKKGGQAGTNIAYAPFVEYGTGKHVTSKDGDKFLENIESWARRHGIKDEDLFFIIRSIRAKGTIAQPFLEPAFIQGERQVKKIINRHMRKALKQVDKLFKKFGKKMV